MKQIPINVCREVLTKLNEGLSYRAVADVLGVSKSLVEKLNKKAAAYDGALAELLSLEDETLQAFLYPAASTPSLMDEIDFSAVQEALKNKHIKLTMIFENFMLERPDLQVSYPHFCKLFGVWKKLNEAVTTSTNSKRVPGEKLEIDFSGDTLKWVDGNAESREAHLFVAALPFSGLYFVYATEDEKIGSWIKGLNAALEYLGGVPRILIVDNARALVLKASKFEGVVHPLIADVCDHYGIKAWACAPYRPKQKNRVEYAVHLTQMWIQGALEMLQTPIYAPNLEELNKKILVLTDQANHRRLSKSETESRYSRFLEYEKPLLGELPAVPYEVCSWLVLTVDKSHCIRLNCDRGHRYSAPASYIGKKVYVRLSEEEVQLFDTETNKLIGRHERHLEDGPQKTHILEAHLTEKEKNRRREPQYFIDVFCRHGVKEETARKFVEGSWEADGDFISRQRLHAINYNLLRQYSPDLLNEALAEASNLGLFSYNRLQSTLEKKVQLKLRQPSLSFEPDKEYRTLDHANIRNNYE